MKIIKDYWYFLFILMVGTTISYVINLNNIQQRELNEQALFKEAAYDRLTSFNRALDNQLSVINQLTLLFQVNNNLSRQGFSDFAQPILNTNPEIMGVAWVKKIPVSLLEKFQFHAYDDGLIDFEFYQLDSSKKAIGIPDKETYYSVFYIDPMQEYRNFLGLDLSYNEKILETMKKSSSENVTAFSEPMDLGVNLNSTILAFSPVFRNDYNVHTPELNENNLVGYVLLFLNLNDFFDYAVNDAFDNENFFIGLEDLDAKKLIIGDNVNISLKSKNTHHIGNFIVDTGRKIDISVDYTGRLWQLNIAAPRHFNAAVHWTELNAALIIGFIISLLCALFLHHQRSTTQSIKKQVKLRTEELALSEAISRSILDNAVDGIISINRDFVISRVNNAICSLFGYEESDLIDKKLEVLFNENNNKDVEEHFTTLKWSEGSWIELSGVKKNGKVFPVKFAISNTGFEGDFHYTCVIHDLTGIKAAQKKLEQLSQTDPLTGLKNRRFFDHELTKEWNRARREKQPIALLLMDVDHFKLYNDTYGHGGGDDCLKSISSALSDSCSRDIDTVARYGGEEFIILLPICSDEEACARNCLENVRKLRIPHDSSKTAECVTISIGANKIIPNNEIEIKDFIEQTDQALYQAKESGRNRYCVYNSVDI